MRIFQKNPLKKIYQEKEPSVPPGPTLFTLSLPCASLWPPLFPCSLSLGDLNPNLGIDDVVSREWGFNFWFGFLFGYWVGDWCTNFRFKFSFWWWFGDWGISLRYWFRVLGLFGCYFIQFSEPLQIPHLYSGMSSHLCVVWLIAICWFMLYVIWNLSMHIKCMS